MPNDYPVNKEDRKLIEKFEDTTREPASGYLVDYFGSKINVNFASHLHPSDRVLNIPIPSDGIFHEFIEYLGTALAMNTTNKESVTVMELGAGFGPWIVRSALMARRTGIKKIIIVGVEADKLHFDWMKQHISDNGLSSVISPDIQIDLINAAVSQKERFLYFPELMENHEDWGAAASCGASSFDYRGVQVKSKRIPALPINKLLSSYKKIDLLHIDIQGSEFGVIKCGMKALNQKARVMVVGTHSRKIEGDLIEMLFNNKWYLRNEKPCQFYFDLNARSLEGMTSVDGTQIWVNSRF